MASRGQTPRIFFPGITLNGLGNHVGIPVTGREQPVGLVVANARLGLRVEEQRPSQAVRDIAQKRQRHRHPSLMDFGVQKGGITAAHRGDPVLEVRLIGDRMIGHGAGRAGFTVLAKKCVIAAVIGKDHVALGAENDRAHRKLGLDERILVTKPGLAGRTPVAMLGLQEKVVPGELAGEGLIVGTLLVVVVDEMRAHRLHAEGSQGEAAIRGQGGLT